jgi:hypothetical protein
MPYHGGDWWQLTDAEESVFVIDRKPILVEPTRRFVE